nr:hypothetical protein [Mycobacterium uberis]
MVPQDDMVHCQLIVNQVLGYAVALRLPPGTSKYDRAKVVPQVLAELNLTKHVDTRVDKLSGGQHKRTSMALGPLIRSLLLILNEPMPSLHPTLDHQVMMMLHHLADAVRIVIVVTHMLSSPKICDQLLVALGGETVYCGPPQDISKAMRTTDWAKTFAQVGVDLEKANRNFLPHNRNQLKAPASAR